MNTGYRLLAIFLMGTFLFFPLAQPLKVRGDSAEQQSEQDYPQPHRVPRSRHRFVTL